MCFGCLMEWSALDGLDKRFATGGVSVHQNWCFFPREWTALTCQGSEACALLGTWSRAWCWLSNQVSTSSTTSWTKPSVILHSPVSSTTMSCSVSGDLVGWVIFGWMAFWNPFSVSLLYTWEVLMSCMGVCSWNSTSGHFTLQTKWSFLVIFKCTFILVIPN